MEKPGQRGTRYAPRGKAYAPRRRNDEVPSLVPAHAAGAFRRDPVASAEAEGEREHTEAASPQSEAATTIAAIAITPPRVRWQARESVALPIAMTVAALALMQQFPSYRLQGGSVHAVAASDSTRAGDVPRLAMITGDGVQTLSTSVAPTVAERDPAPLPLSAMPVDDVAVRDVGHLGAVPLVRACAVPDGAPQNAAIAPLPPDQFGSALASAAEAQTREFVVYDDKYRVIRYPGGDVATLYGVCTDVVVRAYRALGIDLQKLVHESQVGSGDTNISHRRVEALRRFFKKSGASLPITDFFEDYQAGDVVTYHRPQNSGSNDHIAIVSNVTGPSGAPMIVHNRGFGPQVEDALFVNEMTGHFRYEGPPATPAVVAVRRNIVTVSKKSVTNRVAQRASHRMRNSAVRKIRRAAAVRAASGATTPKPAPKL